jgi:hypothetical protein
MRLRHRHCHTPHLLAVTVTKTMLPLKVMTQATKTKEMIVAKIPDKIKILLVIAKTRQDSVLTSPDAGLFQIPQARFLTKRLTSSSRSW